MNQFANFLQLIASQEVIAHNLKGIDVHTAFNQLSNNKEYIQLNDLEVYLRENNIVANPSELNYLFKQMDRDNDQVINQKDFSMYSQRQQARNKEVVKLIQHEIQTAKLLLKFLSSLKELNISILFKTISQRGQISQQQLVDYLQKHYIKLNNQEIICLFSYLDRNRDGLISFSEFQDFFNSFHVNQSLIVLKTNQEIRLVNALYELMFINKTLEDAKLELSQQNDFHSLQAFQQIDQLNKQQFTKLDLELFCMDINIKTNKQQVSLVFDRYSQDGQFITYENFIRLINPKIDPITRDVMQMGPKTQKMFKSVIKLLLESQEQIQNIKERLCYNQEFSVELAFQFLDKLQIGTITIDEFREVFEAHNIQISNKEIEQLISMYNKNSDYKVSYTTFIQGMSPIK
ncbi:hypothetical protein pb186bvf_020455 [Paramecium bursaria]